MYAMLIGVFLGFVLLRYPWPQSIVIESPHMGDAWVALVYPPAGGGVSGIQVQPLLPLRIWVAGALSESFQSSTVAFAAMAGGAALVYSWIFHSFVPTAASVAAGFAESVLLASGVLGWHAARTRTAAAETRKR